MRSHDSRAYARDQTPVVPLLCHASSMTDLPEPSIPLGNHEPAQLARFLVEDFTTAWTAMATCSPDDRVGGNLMFGRQALAYLELASRTASAHDTTTYIDAFGVRLRDSEARYFTALPGDVPVPRDFRLPASAVGPPERQLLSAVFDTARHGLAHLSQQIPVHLTDNKIWMVTFTGVQKDEPMSEELPGRRRDAHLTFRVSPKGHVYLIVCPDVLMADLIWAARLAAIFSKYLAPEYLERPRTARRSRTPSRSSAGYSFSSSDLIVALESGGHPRRPWPQGG
jgi:hypothetical protein